MPKTIEFTIEACSKLTLKYTEGENPKFVECNTIMNVPPELIREHYYDADENPTYDGVKATANAFVSGLITGVHYAHQKGLWDSAAHLRWIIAQLENQFVQNATVTQSNYDEK